jgi:hypothetical protein
MLIVISPAKTLDFDSASTTDKHSKPDFLSHSRQLIDVLRDRSPDEIASLMGISSKLGDLNYQRYTDWHTPFTPANAKQAVLAFRGDVYVGLGVDQYSERDFDYAQKHLRILSGLYGLLRPLDLIQPYRLEMGTSLTNPKGKDLYEFWGKRLTNALNCAIVQEKPKVLFNLASQEYWSAIQADAIDARIVTPNFKDWKNDKYKFISFHAKKARGMMSSYLIKNRVKSVKQAREFDWGGYAFNPSMSDGDAWTFTRRQ